METLTKIPIGIWNTKNVTNISDCFSKCTSMTELPLGIFDNWENKLKLKERRLKIEKLKSKL